MGLLEILSEATVHWRVDENSEPLNYENLTPEYILQLGRSHPQIFQAVELWQRGGVTWEQATYLMIIALAEAKATISEEYLKLLDRTPPAPIVVSKDSVFFEKAMDLCNSERQKQLLPIQHLFKKVSDDQ
jgi:hypothetical protein